jgi:hypothetical protein
MREIEIGVRFDLEKPPEFFGADEVNALIAAGATVAAISPSAVLTRKIGAAGENVQLTISGFAMKVHLMEPSGQDPGA